MQDVVRSVTGPENVQNNCNQRNALRNDQVKNNVVSPDSLRLLRDVRTSAQQYIPPLMPVGLMRTLRARLDLDNDGDKVVFRRLCGESDLRTLDVGHTVIRADPFATGGWRPPPDIIIRHEKVDGSNCAFQNSYHHQSRTIQNRVQDQPTHDDNKNRHSIYQLPRTFARRHHVRTTVANQSGEFALRNHESGRGSVWKTWQ